MPCAPSDCAESLAIPLALVEIHHLLDELDSEHRAHQMVLCMDKKHINRRMVARCLLLEKLRLEVVGRKLCLVRSLELGLCLVVFAVPGQRQRFEISETTPRELAELFIDALYLDGLRCVGNLDAPVSRIWLSSHTMGDRMDADILAEARNVNVFVPFGICDFTLTQYVKDAAALGAHKAILEMGHFNCEELGMRYAPAWLAEAIGTDAPIEFVQVGDTYRYITR